MIGRWAIPAIAALAAACLAVALLATSASAAVSYPAPQTLSVSRYAGDQQIAIDGSGQATIVWESYDGYNTRIQSVRLGADSAPEKIQTLSKVGDDGYEPEVVIDGSGRATVTWSGRAAGEFTARVHSVRLAADGTPGPVRTLSEAGQDAFLPQVAIDSSDRATIVWWREDSENTRIEAVRLAANGTPGPVQTLSEVGEDALDPQLAIDGSDRATVVWNGFDGIQSVRVAADGSPGTVRTLSEAGQHTHEPQLAIDDSDRATVTWRRLDAADYRIQSVRLAADGAPGPVRTLSEGGHESAYQQVGIDSAGRATIVWMSWDTSPNSNFRIRSVRLAADGTPGPVQTLADPPDPTRVVPFPQLAIDGSDRATITWTWWDGRNYSRVEAVRLAADGTPGPVHSLSEGGGGQLAIDGSDRAAIVWRRFDGANERIQSVRSVTTYPETTITSGPSGPTNDTSPSFGFIDAVPTTTYECSLDSGSWSACSSPKSYSGLSDGPHSFAVRSVDVEDDTDPTPASRSFTVDTSPPDGNASAKKEQKQKGKTIVVRAKVKAGEDLDVKASGKVKVNPTYKLKPLTKSVGSGNSKNLKLRLKKSKDAKKIAPALKQGKKATAKLEVNLTDEAGNTKTKKLSVKLKR